ISFNASAADTVTTLAFPTSAAIAIGAAGAGGPPTANVSPPIDSYAGGGARWTAAARNITTKPPSTNRSEAQTYGAAGGLVAVGASTSTVTANGSVKAHIDGVVNDSNNITVQATATDTSDSSATALAGGIVSGGGADADATTSPTVEASTGNHDLTTTGAVMVAPTLTPKATADSLGVSGAAGGGIGDSIAHAAVSPTVSAHVGGSSSTIQAASLTVVATQNLPGNSDDSAHANANGGAGGVLAGISASVASAVNGDSGKQ